MTSLDCITIRGFRSLKALEEFELAPINVMIGANGAGKSNFIRVFSFLNNLRRARLQEYVARAGGADRLLYFGSRVTSSLEIELWFQGKTNGYKIGLVPTEERGLAVSEESAFFWDRERYPEKPFDEWLVGRRGEAGISDVRKSGVAKHVRDYLDDCRVYHFHDTRPTAPLKGTPDINDNRFLRPDGANLAAFLYHLKRKHEAAYSMIERTARQMAPFIDRFVLEPLALNPETIRLEWKQHGSDDYFDHSSLSDGTLRFIALATLFLQPADLRPSVVLIDEPELGLHPAAIALLAALMKSAATKTQVIVATQSALLLDHFAPEDVVVTRLTDQGTEFRRLESEDLAEWLADYSLGQLWEKNELGGRPGSR